VKIFLAKGAKGLRNARKENTFNFELIPSVAFGY
jgi:hypothetical protein